MNAGRGYASNGGSSIEQQQIQDSNDYSSGGGGGGSAGGYNSVPSSPSSPSDSANGGKKIQIVYIKGMHHWTILSSHFLFLSFFLLHWILSLSHHILTMMSNLSLERRKKKFLSHYILLHHIIDSLNYIHSISLLLSSPFQPITRSPFTLQSNLTDSLMREKAWTFHSPLYVIHSTIFNVHSLLCNCYYCDAFFLSSRSIVFKILVYCLHLFLLLSHFYLQSVSLTLLSTCLYFFNV